MTYSKEMTNFIQRRPATVRILLSLLREGWPATVYSNEIVNFIQRWWATVRILLISLREA